MKKIYNAPSMELELFETADVITVSPFSVNNEAGTVGQTTGIPTINVGELEG